MSVDPSSVVSHRALAFRVRYFDARRDFDMGRRADVPLDHPHEGVSAVNISRAGIDDQPRKRDDRAGRDVEPEIRRQPAGHDAAGEINTAAAGADVTAALVIFAAAAFAVLYAVTPATTAADACVTVTDPPAD